MSIWMEIRGPIYVVFSAVVTILLLRRAIIGTRRLMTDPGSLYPPGLTNAQQQQLKVLNVIFGVGLGFLVAFLLRRGFSFHGLWSGEDRSGPHLIPVLVYALFFISNLAPDYGRLSQHLKTAAAWSFTAVLITRAVIMGVIFFGLS
jgi:hypothetical protein